MQIKCKRWLTEKSMTSVDQLTLEIAEMNLLKKQRENPEIWIFDY